MEHFENPSTADQSAFLLRMLFGDHAGEVRGCVNLAYYDLCRTIRGFASLQNSRDVREKAHLLVTEALSELKTVADRLDQASFDEWHESTCESLYCFYKENKFSDFTIGQGQKWLNMAIKYLFVVGPERLLGFVNLYCLSHVPIDNIMLSRFESHGAPQLSKAWSRMNDYKEYFTFQEWIRTHFAGSTPLAVEFHLYQQAAPCVWNTLQSERA